MQTLLFPLHAFLSKKKIFFKDTFFLEYERTLLLTVYFSLEIRSSINFSPKITYEDSSGLFNSSKIALLHLFGSLFFVIHWLVSCLTVPLLPDFISNPISPVSLLCLALSVCSLFLFLSDSSPISGFGLAFVSGFILVSFSCSFT